MREQSGNKVYVCERVQYEEGAWERLAAVPLVDVVHGGAVLEPTLVRACWDDEALYLRFDCEDRWSVSDFTDHDDPLYEQDVVEVFIDEECGGKRYMEIVVSPNNVVFDAMITHDDPDNPLAFAGDRDWAPERLDTDVKEGEGTRVYTIRLPLSNFAVPPRDGTEWRINFYRIDQEEDGTRHYQAWSPTGAVNYHITDRFGTIRFAGE